MACAFKPTFARYKPHLCMLLSQICYAIVYFITEAAFSQGLNPHIYKIKAKVDISTVFGVLFAFSHRVGICVTLNMYFPSLKYTSPAFVASIFNTVPSWTFLIAIILRMEVVDVKNPRGIAKILGRGNDHHFVQRTCSAELVGCFNSHKRTFCS
ncbi:hypothetical protein QQP08_003020 [Theobroma cacao]|nr:hypothetical protein QQP08_003020 [Theobroma cacao]